MDEWEREQERLAKTLDVVAQEKRKCELDLGMTDGNDRLIHVMDDGSDDALVQQFVTRMKLRTLHQLRLSQKQPYFARLDFTPDEKAPVFGDLRPGEKATVYVGRWGVIKTPEYKVWVADWRSPVANLYYSGQLGKVSYEAPDGKVEGEMSLKRMLSIRDGKLESMQDTGLAGQERFLTDALSKATTARLRDVVTTIQAEQNAVIRFDPKQPLCVQGVAGSGKTTIALHRIAWILYRLQKEIAPQQMIILAPNPLFLSYISRVLPDLGVDDVRQTTFQGLCAWLMGKRMPKVTENQRLRDRLGMSKAQRDQLDDVLRRKGALSLAEDIRRFLRDWEERCLPARDVTAGSAVVITAEEMRRFFLIEFRHFPLEARLKEVKKVAALRLSELLRRAEERLEQAVDERVQKLLAAMPDGEERRRRARELYDARDERLRQSKERKKSFPKEFDALWGSMELLTVYGAFWTDRAERDAGAREAAEQTLRALSQKRVAPEDLPALLLLANGLYGLKKLDARHVVIDEAQDVSPLQVKALREITGRDSFTLVGDLCQGIYGDEGLRSWEDIGAGIFEKPVWVTRLSVAYRSTVEIMEAAFSVIARHPVEGEGAARPVLRHGEKPRLLRVESERERAERIGEAVKGWQREGFQGIAVIVKTEKAAKALYKALLPNLPGLLLTGPGDDAFQSGVQVMDASLVKGLEFDCVIIADAEDETYPDERFYAKLFYVLCTRPLHRLLLLHRGAPVRHLANADVAGE